jgi:phosphoglycolate phosphatase
MPESRFGLVIFDLDGTLVDSEAMLVGLVNQTLAAHGHPLAPPRSVAATIGLPLEEVFRHAVAQVDAAAIASLCTHYRARADAMDFVGQFRLFDGVAATLAAARATGARLVVATSKSRATSLDIVRHCGIADVFDDVIGGDCVARGKPHPEMVERALVTYGTAPARTLVVGDTTFDIEMGQAASVATCGVTYGMHEARRLRALQPTFLIDRFDALTALIDGSQRA